MFDMTKVGEQISLLRKEKGLTQEKLAESMNISPQAVSKWENGHTLPETSLLPQLAKLLDCSIDTILIPNELQFLEGVYTDGNTSYSMTNRLNKLIDNNKINISVNEQTLIQVADSGRLWFLLVKYKNCKGTYYQAIKQGESLALDSESTGHMTAEKELHIIDAYYGNSEYARNVMNKIEHYEFFNRNRYWVNHEAFPSNPATSKLEYLSILFINDSGLHIAVCEERESLVYSADKRSLYREPFISDKKVINGVEPLEWKKGMDCSWAGALTAALRAMGEDTTYEKVMGVSGACYRLAFCHPKWDYSSVDGLVAYNYAVPGYKAFGFEPVLTARVDKEKRDIERRNIINSLNQNKPVLAINLRCAPEWGVITGYQDEGKTFLCRTYYDKQIIEEKLNGVDQYLEADNWPFIITHFGHRIKKPTDQENLINSLKVMLECNNQERTRGYYMGYRAYEVWTKDLREGSLFENIDDKSYWRFSSVNHFCMMALVDARRCAYKYIRISAGSYIDVKAEILLEISERYRLVYEMANEIYKQLHDLCPTQAEEARMLWTRELQIAQADMFEKSMKLEKEAELLARKFIALIENDNETTKTSGIIGLDDESIVNLLQEKGEDVSNCSVYRGEVEKRPRSLNTKVKVRTGTNQFHFIEKVMLGKIKELRMYNLFSKMDISIPKIYYNDFDKKIILLEDLDVDYIKAIEWDENTANTPIILRNYPNILKAAAKMHSIFWENYDAFGKVGLPWHLEKGNYPAHINGVEKTYKQYRENHIGKVEEKVFKYYEYALEYLRSEYFNIIYPRYHEGKKVTVIHGDLHCNNIYVPKDSGRNDVKFIDLEAVKIGLPTDDLVMLLALHIAPDKASAQPLLDEYYGYLSKEVKDYSYAEFMADYKASLLSLLSFPNRLVNDGIKDYEMVKRSITAFKDFILPDIGLQN